MTFTVDLGKQFLLEWPNYLQPQRDCVTQFIALVKVHGLDQTKLPGRLTSSAINASAADHAFALQHSLWHYHVGYPSYRNNGPGRPMTSEWLLHFQWVTGSTHIDIVDLYEHWTSKKTFHIPSTQHVVTPAPTAAPSGPAASIANPPDPKTP